MSVLITRTEPGASRLANVLAQAGVVTTVSPLIDIRPLSPWQVERFTGPSNGWVSVSLSDTFSPDALPVRTTLSDGLAGPDKLVFVSTHAAKIFLRSEFWQQLLANNPSAVQQIQVYSVGPGTAAVLKDAGLDATVPSEYTSEGLLELADFCSPVLNGEEAIWLVAGLGGREVFAETLYSRVGQEVCKIAVYERVNITTAVWDTGTISAVIVASQQSLMQFQQLWIAQGGDLQITLIVPSKRLAQAARELGFTSVLGAASAQDQAFVEVICNDMKLGSNST